MSRQIHSQPRLDQSAISTSVRAHDVRVVDRARLRKRVHPLDPGFAHVVRRTTRRGLLLKEANKLMNEKECRNITN